MNITYLGHNNTDTTGLATAFGGLLSATDLRLAIKDFEHYLLNLEGAQTDIPSYHHFAPGNYAREMHIPPRVVIVGKLHKHAHINIISKGKITVVTEHEGVQTLEAPCTFISKPGTKRVVCAHEETVWTTIHPTNETDLDKIEAEVIAKTYDEIELEGTL